jgi:O-antigen/teichoic acid export membrane protein
MKSISGSSLRLFSSLGSLKLRAARAAIWITIGQGTARTLGTAKVLILARLVAPEEFGLLGIATLLLGCLEYLTELGFRDALVQRQSDIRRYLDAVWTAQIIRGAGLCALLLIGAPTIAWIYGEPRSAGVIRTLAISTLLQGFVNPAVVYFRKNLEFGREVIWRLIGGVTGLLVALLLAVRSPDVTALTGSLVVAAMAEVVASYFVRPYRPRLVTGLGRLADLATFARAIWSLRVISLATLQLDSWGVARFASLASLAHYQMAARIGNFTAAALASPVQAALFPVFSMMRGTSRRDAFLRGLGIVLSIGLPVSAFACVFSTPLISLVLGDSWVPVASLLGILAWNATLVPIGQLIGAMVSGIGRPELDVRINLVKLVVLAMLIYPMTSLYGGLGAASLAVGSSLLSVVYGLWVAKALLRMRMSDIAASARGGCLASVPILACGTIAHPEGSPVALASVALAILVSAASVHAHFVDHRSQALVSLFTVQSRPE